MMSLNILFPKLCTSGHPFCGVKDPSHPTHTKEEGFAGGSRNTRIYIPKTNHFRIKEQGRPEPEEAPEAAPGDFLCCLLPTLSSRL